MALLILLLCLHAGCSSPAERAEEDYDTRTGQQPVTRHGQLDSVLATFPKIPFAKLDTAYLRYAGIEGKWKQQLSRKTWYIVEGDEGLRFVVGHLRVQHFLPRDDYYSRWVSDPQAPGRQFLCLDKRVLHKLLDLMHAMEREGLDPSQLAVNHGFRHPTFNTAIGGATRSRHQWGEAIDLLVGDVNHDGELDQADKKPLLALLEEEIIADGGGVGRYPHSQVIHMDVRGYKARWDFQK